MCNIIKNNYGHFERRYRRSLSKNTTLSRVLIYGRDCFIPSHSTFNYASFNGHCGH